MAPEYPRTLAVVGAGISGLAAAWFYRRRRPDDTILLLDNHDDFGGHAKRNEFHVDGRMLLGYGGSEAMQSPHALYSEVAAGLVRSLGVDIERFEQAFDRTLYPSLGLSRGVFAPDISWLNRSCTRSSTETSATRIALNMATEAMVCRIPSFMMIARWSPRCIERRQ